MNIYLIAYTKNNLGDDLFTSMLVSKYPNVNFYINIDKREHTESLKQLKNVNIIEEKRELEKIDVNKYDAIVYIAGSIFMEKNNGLERLKKFNKFIKKAKENKVPFFYISSNFGPYTTEEYLEIAKDTFSNCEDVCFRDKYSYELFKKIGSVRYASDLIFSYNLEKYKQEKDTVGISIIDLSIRGDLKNLENRYLEALRNNINNYQKAGKTVYLFSYCEYEGDEKAIEKLEKLIDNKEKLKIVKYNGNIKEFLAVYSKMEYMICTRFHSMILSTKLQQKVLVLSYSKKIDNVIKDLDLPFNIESLDTLKKDKVFKLEEFKKVEKEKLNNIIINSSLQLKMLDNLIKQ